jgi:hypothetical protein
VSSPTVHLISNDNGVGLSTDMQLLEDMLTAAGYTVQRFHWKQTVMPRCDIAIFLELYNHALARYADKKIGIFNLEWFPVVWRPYLKTFDQLWAKSTEAHEVYRRFGLESHMTGFMTRDLYDPEVRKTNSCLHLRGKSSLKGTEAVLSAWQSNPDLPPLTIISADPLKVPAGVRVLSRMPQDELVREMNTHRIHVCPSKSEGWGHYITEGMSTGALVVTTDASPMSDHVQPDRGFLVPTRGGMARHMAREYHVTADDLAHAVRVAASLHPMKAHSMSQQARQYALDSTTAFRFRALELLKEL